jgi:uncharacterized membrane protein
MISMKKLLLTALVIVIISFIIGIASYTHLPNMLASHWGENGNVNGYMPKFWALFLIPVISAALLLLFYFLPRIDPLKKNYEKFMKYYDSFILLIIIFMFYIYILTILWNFHVNFSMNLALIPALGFLFFYAGVVMKHLKRNWFIGIRTPWTISSDKVWDKTHKLGSILFRISGVVTLIGIFFESLVLWFLLVPIILSAIGLIIYSYLVYRKNPVSNIK